MTIVLSTPTGYNARELLLPLHRHLASDNSISEVHIITPAAAHRDVFFSSFEEKFHFHTNPQTLQEHIELLRRIQPSVIVTPTVGLDAKDTFILRAGKQLSIPTVTFIASWDNIFKMERLRQKGFSGAEKGRAKDYEIPDFVAVWNQLNYDHLRTSFADEIDANRITITGPPRFDYFNHSERIPGRAALLSYLGFSPDQNENALLHCATTELYPFEYIIKTLHKKMQSGELPANTLLYASVHPGGDIQKHAHYQQYGAQVKYSFGRRDNSPLPEFSYLPTDEEIYYLIALWKHSAILINQSSTVALESMAANRPVINVAYGQRLDWIGWYRSMVYRDFKQHYRYITNEGGTTLAKNSTALIQATKEYLEHPSLHQIERQKTVIKLVSFTDGKNSDRLLKYIKQCAVS